MPVYLLSNTGMNYALDGMRFSHLSAFAGIIDCDEVRIYKPRREIFERGLGVAGCSAEEGIHIGDSRSPGIIRAQPLPGCMRSG